jgi:hypothetical protein
MILPIDSSYTSYLGALGTCPASWGANRCNNPKGTPIKIEGGFPSSNGEQLKSWEVPARPFFTFVPTATAVLGLVASPAQTTPLTTSLVYNGPGYFFEVGNLLLEPGQLDLFEVAPGGTTITYTTSITGTGGDHEFLLGFETASADFDFYLHDFEMEAGDAVVLTIDVEHLLVDVKIVTTSPTDDIIFSFAMERIGDSSTEIFESPDEGMTLANGETLLIDYSEWDGNGKPLHMGYDDNHNSMLDADEKFDIVDSGDTFEK